jgi:hypothetical protein
MLYYLCTKCVIETVWVTEGCKYVPRGPHLFQTWYRTLEGPIYDKGLLQIFQAVYLIKTINIA